MTLSRGLMKKSPNTPRKTLNTIERTLEAILKKQPDGRWKYPDKQNDTTVAEMIGEGATPSAVRNMRIANHPGKLVIQQIRPRPKKVKPVTAAFVYPKAGEALVTTTVEDLTVRLALLSSEFDVYKGEQETKYRALWNLIDQRTAPSA